MAKKATTKGSKKEKSGSKKGSKQNANIENSKNMGVLNNIGNAVKKVTDTITGKNSGKKDKNPETTLGENKKTPDGIPPVIETKQPQGILPEGDENSGSVGNDNITTTIAGTKGEGIEPVVSENPDVKAPEKKEAKKKSNFFSDEIIEITSDSELFLNAIKADKGLKIHRVEKEKFLFSGIDTDPVTGKQTPFESLFPDELTEEDKKLLPPTWADMFQKELDAYKVRQKEQIKADKLKPKPKAGVDAPPVHNKVEAPIAYAETGVEDMKAYGEIIYNQMMKSPVVTKRNDKFTAIEVENNLKKETTLYKFMLKFDQVNRGWYIDIIQGNNAVRVPNDKTKFLPIK